ncbi:MAG TPA: purine-nucleoside phosphorylase [Phnomibacter sp.]|nr:purine-nucleoside phosphorylase [Phnomibacter sp.]
MSIHISAAATDIAPIVLMPGDPLRAKLFAEKYLEQPRLVSATRNVFYYTGTYQGRPLTIGASGMGCASIGIYSYELFTEYHVQHIIRIGTCGAYTTELKLFDILNVSLSASESSFARAAYGYEANSIQPEGNTFHQLQATAKNIGQPITTCAVHCSDYFYSNITGLPPVAIEHQCKAVEMEAFALFNTAKELGKSAACLLTVSDIIPTRERISAVEREQALIPMVELALATTLTL